MKIEVIKGDAKITYEEIRSVTEYYQGINGDDNNNRVIKMILSMIEGVVRLTQPPSPTKK